MTTPDSSPARDIARYEQAYADSGFEVVQARFRKRLLLELLERERPRRVLEVGCGLDTLANHWRGAERFVVVEPGAQFAETARVQTQGRADVAIVEATLEAAADELAGGFDLVIVSGLLHEVVDSDALLAAAARVAQRQALVHANVPNANSLHRLLAVEMGLIEDPATLSDLQRTLQQHRTYSLETLEAQFRDHGFEVVERGGFFIKPFTHAQMQQLRDLGMLTDQMLEGLWGLARRMPQFGSEIYLNAREKGAP